MTECPVATVYHSVNLNNHVQAIKLANLGPADPRQPNTLFWGDKMELWNVEEGVARSQLCLNCAYYKTDSKTMQCISTGEGGTLKPSELPVTPSWADIPGMPVGYCTRWAITCSALRTCDSWESQAEQHEEHEDADGWNGSTKSTQTYIKLNASLNVLPAVKTGTGFRVVIRGAMEHGIGLRVIWLS